MDFEGDFSAQSILAQKDRILASAHFARSAALSKFLGFVIQHTLGGKEQELKEYRLGVDVFSRGADFDPRVDPIVRMQASKLRARLAEYYSSEGRNDPIMITVPKGAYVPVFTRSEIAPPAARDRDVQSIAVLPFVSMSGDPENEYFSDGLTEEVINVLTCIPGLRVVARTSVFCFKNAVKDVREIGAQLNVRTVLEGSVRRSGNQLRVTAQLIDVATGYHLFSRTFPRELHDVFALQEELAGAVVTEIMPTVGGGSHPAVVRNHTADLESYNLYLKGMFALASRFTGPRESVEIFRQALDRDPTYAPAWAGLANAYCIQVWYGMMPSKVALPMAKHAALEALGRDEAFGLGHATLGVAQAIVDWNWKGAERSFRRAIEVQPSLAIAHQYYATNCLMPQRRYQEGLLSTERALLLNPFDAVLCGGAMFIYTAVGNYSAALRQFALSKEVNPNHPATYLAIGTTHETEGRMEEALPAYRRACELSRRAPYAAASLGHALAQSGAIGEAREVLWELRGAAPYGYAMALLHAGLGDRADAIRWFEKGMEDREPHLLLAPFDPRFAPLLEDRDFRQLLAQMGLVLNTLA